MRKKQLLLLSFVLVLFVSSISAQLFKKTRNNQKESSFAVEYALFKSESEDKIARVEVYYQILNSALNFEEIDQAFEAKYELTISVSKDNKVYDSYQRNQIVRVEDKSKTKSKFDYRTNQVNFFLEEGKYEIFCTLYDPVHNNEQQKKIKLKVKKYNHKKPMISDIELVQAISKASDVPSVFDKGKLQLVPSVRHKYGVSGNTSFFFYMELYQGSQNAEDVLVETVLRHQAKGMLYRDSLTTTFTNSTEKQFRELKMEDLRPGNYELIVTLRDNRRKKIDVQYKDFEIIWTPQSLIKFDYDMLVKQIQLIATTDEVKALKDKETYEERLTAFNRYWNANDPTPGTFENETKNEFYRRVSVANYNFSYLFGNGWKSDRGRIYIMYGEPDQLDDFPLVSDRHPYQEWHYYRGAKYLKFVFIDSNEDGDYRLIYPYDGLYQRPTN